MDFLSCHTPIPLLAHFPHLACVTHSHPLLPHSSHTDSLRSSQSPPPTRHTPILSPSFSLSLSPSSSKGLLDVCGTPAAEETRARLRGLLGDAASQKKEWERVAARLVRSKLCTAECALELEKYLVTMCWRPSELPKMRSLLQHSPKLTCAPKRQQRALEALEALTRALDGAVALGVPAHQMRVDVRIALPHGEFSSPGLQLQVLCGDGDEIGVLLRGGRYDALLSRALGAKPEKHFGRCAVGMSVRTARLVELGCFEPLGAQTELEALVCSEGAFMQKRRMELAGILWRERLRVDLTHGESPDLSSQANIKYTFSVLSLHVAPPLLPYVQNSILDLSYRRWQSQP